MADDEVPLLRHLTADQVRQLDLILGQLLQVSPFGRITLEIQNGRIRFILPAPSIEVPMPRKAV